jgi:hypothetical protein
MISRSRWIRVVAVAALLAIAVFRSGDRAMAVQDSEDKVLFGPIGIAASERVRVNIYTIGHSDTIGNPDILPWDFVVRVFNRRGVMVLERKLQVQPGATGSLEVRIQDEEDFPVETLGRRSLRAEIIGFNPQPDPPGKYVANLEVFNRLTGRTSILLGGLDTLPAAVHR